MARGRGQGTGEVGVRGARYLPLGMLREHPDFHVRERDGKYLIVPAPSKHRWEKDELWYRSMVVDSAGRLLSAGLPKFRNYGEDSVESVEFIQHLHSGSPVLATEKMDGSLAIRSVIDGEVVFRTRGTVDGGDEYGPAIRKVASEKYPHLLDPSLYPEGSLHFEFVHPDFPIIIRYPDPDLVLLSGVRHQDLRLLDYKELTDLAQDASLKLVPAHALPHREEELIELVSDWKDKEGVVLRYQGEQAYIKIKAEHYRVQHALRYQFGAKAALELCKQHDFPDEKSYVDHLYALGMDWELAEERKQYYNLYRHGKDSILDQKLGLENFYSKNAHLLPEGRKDYALAVQAQYTDRWHRSYLFARINENTASVEERWLDEILHHAADEMSITEE
jgi:hypothetical protein